MKVKLYPPGSNPISLLRRNAEVRHNFPAGFEAMSSLCPSPVSSDDSTEDRQQQHACVCSDKPTVSIRSSAASIGGGGVGDSAGWRPGTMIDLVKERGTERQEQEQEQLLQQQKDRQQQQQQQQQQQHEEDGEEKVDKEMEEEDAEERDDSSADAPSRRRVRFRERIRVSLTSATIGRPASSDDEYTADNGEGKWFIGKYTGKIFHHGAMHLLGLVNDESKQRKDGAPVVGMLTLTFKGTRGLGGEDGVSNPYFEVWCEGTKRLIKPKTSQNGGVGEKEGGGDGSRAASPLAHPHTDKEWRETRLQFEVTDITTDVHVLLLDKRPLRTLTIGRLILPLPNFLGYHHPLPPRTSAFDLLAAKLIDGGRRPKTTQRLLSQKYVPQMKQYIHSSPLCSEEWVVGQVILEVALKTPHNLFHTYLASRPLLADSFSTPRSSTSAATAAATEKAAAAAAADLTIQNVNLRVLAINIFRLKIALLPPSLLLILLDHPILFLALFTYLLVAPTWALPLHLALLILLNGALTNSSSSATSSSPSSPFPSFPPSFPPLEFCPSTPPSSVPPSSSPQPIELWPHVLVERILQMEAYSAPKKIRRLINLVRWTQDFLGIVSSLLERASYLFSWADPHVTLPMTVFVMAGALLMSLLLYVMSPVVVMWCVVVWVYLKVRRRMNEMKAMDGAAETEKDGKEQKINEEEDEEGNERAVYKVFEINWRNWVENAPKSFVLNILARTPDALDVMHREIARRRVHDEKEGQKCSDDNHGRTVSGHRKID